MRNFVLLAITSAALLLQLEAAETPEIDPQTAIQIEALSRLKGMDLEANPALKAAVVRVLEKIKGTPKFVELVRDFQLKGQNQALLEYALARPTESSSAEAVRLILADGGLPLLQNALESSNAPAAMQAMAYANDRQLYPVFEQSLQNTTLDLNTRKEAVRALSRSRDGAQRLIDLAENDNLPSDLLFTATSELHLSPWPQIKEQAAKVLPLPQSQGEPLPPLAELVKRKGDPKRGAEIYRRPEVACITCHQVKGEGTDFGPNLSEIGSKLGKDALYESILDPSSGISFGYEAWTIETHDGEELFGLLTSETADELAIKAQTGIVTKVKKREIAKRQMMKTSIMPAGLQMTMTTEDLVDLVEYLASLRKP